MAGLKDNFPGVFAKDTGYGVTPDEMDMYRKYDVIFPTTSITWFGTTAAGTAGAAKAYVVINKTADYPRNVAAAVEGTADMGGVWVINGKNQFGESITETITVGTAANGGTVAGTKIFAEVLSGTCTIAATGVGNGTPKLGVDTTGTTLLFGLPDKIASTADVKAITWAKENVVTTLNGGTIGAYVDTTQHGFRGTADLAGTEVYSVLYKPTYNASGQAVQANL